MTRTRRSAVLLASLALTLTASACGGDDEPEPVATPQPATTTGTTETTTADTTEETTTEEATEETTTTETRERERERERERDRDEGDEEEARTEVQLRGRGGRVTPRRVSVPPFLAIRVILRSRDSNTYFVTLGGSGVSAPPRERATLELDGLRPGKSYDGRFFVNGRPTGQIVIVADAEGGP